MWCYDRANFFYVQRVLQVYELFLFSRNLEWRLMCHCPSSLVHLMPWCRATAMECISLRAPFLKGPTYSPTLTADVPTEGNKAGQLIERIVDPSPRIFFCSRHVAFFVQTKRGLDLQSAVIKTKAFGHEMLLKYWHAYIFCELIFLTY